MKLVFLLIVYLISCFKFLVIYMCRYLSLPSLLVHTLFVGDDLFVVLFLDEYGTFT